MRPSVVVFKEPSVQSRLLKTFTDPIALGAFGLGPRIIDIIEDQKQLVVVGVRLPTELSPAIRQNPNQRNPVLLIKRNDPISKLLLEHFKDHRIDTITTQDIHRYQDWRRNSRTPRMGKSISGATVNREIALRHALRKAIRWGYVARNPAIGIEGFSESKRERYITHEEFEAIKRVAKSHDFSRHLADIMDVSYHTAQRSWRILSLKWNQLNLKERTMTFEQVSKNKRVPHVIWINDPLFALLSRMRKTRKSLIPWVFNKQDGTPYKSINKGWNTACKKAGVEDANINHIRHKAMTDMVRAGFSLGFVGRVAGHSTPSTAHRYAHLLVDATKEALDSLGKKVAK